MRGLDWGSLYEKYHKQPYDPAAVSQQVKKLYGDPFVKKRGGIFEYVLGGSQDTKLLEVRVFDEATKRAAYEKQTAAAKASGTSNCPLCALGHDANKAKIWKLAEMDADHVTAWSKGGGTRRKIARCCASRTTAPKAIVKARSHKVIGGSIHKLAFCLLARQTCVHPACVGPPRQFAPTPGLAPSLSGPAFPRPRSSLPFSCFPAYLPLLPVRPHGTSKTTFERQGAKSPRAHGQQVGIKNAKTNSQRRYTNILSKRTGAREARRTTMTRNHVCKFCQNEPAPATLPQSRRDFPSRRISPALQSRAASANNFCQTNCPYVRAWPLSVRAWRAMPVLLSRRGRWVGLPTRGVSSSSRIGRPREARKERSREVGSYSDFPPRSSDRTWAR